jgi:hypothetical protein
MSQVVAQEKNHMPLRTRLWLIRETAISRQVVDT